MRYGDIVKGLPLKPNSVGGLFCSHVLEHLTLEDFSSALANSYNYLKCGGIFRIIVPDLAYYINSYTSAKESNDLKNSEASLIFMKGTCLGRVNSRNTIYSRVYDAFLNSSHRWMWDFEALSFALNDHGFVKIRRFAQGECEDQMFLLPERNHQFGDRGNQHSLAIECRKSDVTPAYGFRGKNER